MEIIADIAIKFAVISAFGLFFLFLQKASPSIPEQKFITKEFRLDAQYWVLSTFISPILHGIFVTLIFTIIYMGNNQLFVERTYLSSLPPATKIITAIILLDFAGYWVHRFYHEVRLWKIHSIHHSPKEIDWLTSLRFHPFDQMFSVTIQYLLVVAILGFSMETAIIAHIIRAIYGFFVHANLSWTYGKLGYVIASPVFHRWHHTMEEAGLNKNYAGVFSFWDYIFKTAYSESNRQPENFGIGEDIGNNIISQTLYPFKRTK